MKAKITSTDAIVHYRNDNNMCRVWEGVTEAGVPFVAYIALCQVSRNADNSEFERELMEHKTPDAATVRAIDARMII